VFERVLGETALLLSTQDHSNPAVATIRRDLFLLLIFVNRSLRTWISVEQLQIVLQTNPIHETPDSRTVYFAAKVVTETIASQKPRQLLG